MKRTVEEIDGPNDEDMMVLIVGDAASASQHATVHEMEVILSELGTNCGDTERDEDVVGIPMIIELPRDILTAFILMRVDGKWDELDRRSRISIWFGLISSYLIQFLVFTSLANDCIGQLQDGLKVDASGSDWWYDIPFAL